MHFISLFEFLTGQGILLILFIVLSLQTQFLFYIWTVEPEKANCEDFSDLCRSIYVFILLIYILTLLDYWFFFFLFLLLLDYVFLASICFFQTHSRNGLSVLFTVSMSPGEKDFLSVFRQLYYFILFFQKTFFQVTVFCLLIYLKKFSSYTFFFFSLH